MLLILTRLVNFRPSFALFGEYRNYLAFSHEIFSWKRKHVLKKVFALSAYPYSFLSELQSIFFVFMTAVVGKVSKDGFTPPFASSKSDWTQHSEPLPDSMRAMSRQAFLDVPLGQGNHVFCGLYFWIAGEDIKGHFCVSLIKKKSKGNLKIKGKKDLEKTKISLSCVSKVKAILIWIAN